MRCCLPVSCRVRGAHRADLRVNRTVPTEDQILVPETLLKKRKSQEKEREARSAELEKKKQVGPAFTPKEIPNVRVTRKEALQTWMLMMIPTNHATRP